MSDPTQAPIFPSLFAVVTAVCEHPALFTPSGTFMEAASWLDRFGLGLRNEFNYQDEWSLFRMWLPRQMGEASNCAWMWVIGEKLPRDEDALGLLKHAFEKYDADQYRFITLLEQKPAFLQHERPQRSSSSTSLIELLSRITVCPKMFCVGGTLEEACAGILGIIAGQRRTDPTVVAEWDTFEAWLLYSLGYPGDTYPDAYAWYYLLRRKYPEDKAAFAELGRLSEEYLAGQTG